MKTVKLRWAKKLMRARYFVLLTDKESVIAMDGVNPDKFEDVLSVTAQGAALEDFRDSLNDLIKRHDKRAQELLGGKGDIAKNKKPKATRVKASKSKARKIPVKSK